MNVSNFMEPPSREPSGDPRKDIRKDSVPGAGSLGMKFLIASLSVLFAASMIGYIVVRQKADAWPPPGMPRLPSTLWISTIILLASSVTIHGALTSIRGDRQGGLKRGLLLTTILGLAFLIAQIVIWLGLISVQLTAQTNLYGFTFFVLTGLHGAHVLGGLIPLVLVTARAFRGHYTSLYHPGVLYVSMYWHFLDAVWLVIFSVLYFFA